MISVFFGENFLIKRYFEDLTQKKVKIFDLEEENFENFEKEATCENLFEKKEKVLVLRNFEKNEDFKKKFLEKKEKFKNLKTEIVFWYKEKPTKKDKFFENLKEISEVKEFKAPKLWQLEKWVDKEISRFGVKMEESAKRELVQRVGENLWQLHFEIKKLTAYKKRGIIRKEDVENLVPLSLNENVFEILRFLLEGKKQKAFLLLQEFIKRGENQIKLYLLFKTQLKNLILLKELSEKKLSFSEISQKTGFHPYFIQKNWFLIKKWKKEDLLKLYSQIFKYSIWAKSGKIESSLGFSFCFLEV
jgi:DNA polymerase-3 subunit delta